MEARVDVRKLQLLNDRISQMIDALNQVRLSVHGLSHTPIVNSQVGALGYPYLGYGAQNFGVPGYGIQPGFAGANLQGLPITSGFGLQHTAFTPYGTQGVTPFVNPGLMSTPWISGIGGGLFHSSPDQLEQRLIELRATDPARINQTFPFAFSIPTTVPVSW
jgi:hypothetical protein